MRDYSVDPKRVYVGGLSAGGAAAAIMGATYNDLYAAIGVHSGLACGAAIDLPSAFVAMRQGGGSDDRIIPGDGPPVPTIVFHGDRDTTVHPNNGDLILEQSIRTTSTQKKVHRGRIPGGHAYTRTILTEASGRAILEHWNIHGAGHAWSGGCPAAPTPIREGRTQPGTCCVSSLSIRSHGSQVSVSPFVGTNVAPFETAVAQATAGFADTRQLVSGKARHSFISS